MKKSKTSKSDQGVAEKDFEEQSISGSLLDKWITLPMGILTLLVAGSVLNLIGYFLALKDELWLNPREQEFIRWGAAIGYYAGVLAGPLLRSVGTKLAFIVSAVVSLIGFTILGFYTDDNYIGTASSVIIVILLAMVSFCGCIATLASVSIILKNFPKATTPILVSLLITYYMIAPYFEKCIRSGFLHEYSFKATLIICGVIQFVTYIVAAFSMKEVEFSVRMLKACSSVDRIGVVIFIVIEGIFIGVIYFSCIVANKWRSGAYQMVVLNVANFGAMCFCVFLLKKRIQTLDLDDVVVDIYHKDQDLKTTFKDVSFYILMIGTFIVVGSCTAFQLEAPTVAFAMGVPELGIHATKAFWVSDVIARFLGGILAALFSIFINRYILAGLISFCGMIGFIFALLSQPVGATFFYISAFVIGGSVGAFWVIVPLIIYQEKGVRNFEILWGIVITINVLGVLVFDKTFMWVGDKEEPYEIGFCEGYSCYLPSFIIAALLCGFSGLLCMLHHFGMIGNPE
ncbi:unnamed protein product [Moneuplotes crassus]|uniref:Uncharacterized protein n=1 Tax=Euplotes crassus TaxID=5936 RepID=A0AAD1UBJ5_EUPCR|nr:unnamed protein product [Moneuplotes crassus]